MVLVSAPEEEEENCHDNSKQQESTEEREAADVQPQTLPHVQEEGTDDETDRISVEQGVSSSAEPGQLDVEVVQLPAEKQLQHQEESKEEGPSQSVGSGVHVASSLPEGHPQVTLATMNLCLYKCSQSCSQCGHITLTFS